MIILTLAQTADLATGLLLPAGAEANPLSALLLALPPAAIAAKWLVVVVTLEAARRLPRWPGAGLVAFATLVGLVGFGSNLRVLL
jgi:hypothetical protein